MTNTKKVRIMMIEHTAGRSLELVFDEEERDGGTCNGKYSNTS